MIEKSFDRRRFLAGALALSGMAAGVAGSAILGYSRSWARGDAPSKEDKESVVRMARLLYPHDSLSDQVYGEVLNNALLYVADGDQFVAILDAAEQKLDSLQPQLFIELEEAAQIAALQSIQEEPFFGAILYAVTIALYMHPASWEMMGYEGPSYMHGGYLHRGAGVIDWLQEV